MSNSNQTFETSRLHIRRFTLDDVEGAFEMMNDPEVQEFIIGEEPPTPDYVRSLIKKNILGDYEKCGFGRMAVVLKSENKFIGFTGLKFDEELQEVDLGYRLNRRYWGQGYATEAAKPMIEYGFQILHLPRIVAAALPENHGSINVMKKLGMHFDGMRMIDGFEMVFYVLDNPENQT